MKVLTKPRVEKLWANIVDKIKTENNLYKSYIKQAQPNENIAIIPEPNSSINIKSIISPYQSGKGRPYAGGKGKNMLPPAAVSEITSNGIKFTPLDDGGIHLEGTCTASAGSGAFFNVPMNIAVAAGNYRFSAGNTTACPDLQIRLTNASGTVLLNNAANIALNIDHVWKPLTFNAETTVAKYVLRFTGGATYDVTIYPMLAIEGEATDFEPYENLRPMVGCNSLQLIHDGESYERAIAETVYGGEYDWKAAQMTVTHRHIASYNGEALPGEWISDRDVYAAGSTPSNGAEVVYRLETPNVYTVGEVIDLRANDGINHLEANTEFAAEYVESDLSAQDRADKVEAVDNFVFGEKELTGERIMIDCKENDTIKISGDGEIKLRHSLKNIISTIGGNGSIYSNNGVTYTRSLNGAITISGTASKGSSFILMKDYIPAGRYILSATRMMKDTVGYVDINTIADDGTETQIARLYNRKETVFVLPEGAQVMVRVYTTITGAAIDETLSLMLEMSDVGTTATEYEPYAGAVKTVTLPAELNAHEGINSLYADGGALTVEIKNNLDDQIDDDVKKSKQDDIEELVGKLGLPILDLAGDISAMSKDNAVELQYSFRDRAGTCTCKWQGASSQYYPKKNYTLKFDEKFEAVVTDTDALDEFRKPWGTQKKFVMKANWIDASHLRNIVSAKLWADIVATRSNLPEQLINSPNYGAIAGFPIMIRINGISQGLYTWNIPKDDWMAGMGDGEKEAIVCAEVTDSLGTRFMGVDNLKFKDDEGNELAPDFELEYVTNEDDTAWVTESLKTMIQACIDSDGSDIDTKLAQYIDIDSAIDYYIFTVLLRGVDMMSRNYLLMTYDGVKWRFGAYDLDSTYGISGTGNSYITGGKWTTSGGRNATFEDFAAYHRLMGLIYTYKKDALVQRYNQLRGHVLEKDTVYDKFLNFANTIPKGAYDVDRLIWPHIPSSSTSSVDQIMTQYAVSCELADEELGRSVVERVNQITDEIYGREIMTDAEIVSFELGGINGSGILLTNNIRIRTELFPVTIGDNVYSVHGLPENTIHAAQAHGYLNGEFVRYLTYQEYDPQTIINGTITISSDGSFDSVRISLKKSDESEFTQDEVDSAYLLDTPVIENTTGIKAKVFPCAGKKLVAIGDSITYGYIPANTPGYSGKLNSYVELTAEKLGMEIVNKGYVGSTLANYADRNPMCTRYEELPDDADIVTIMGGTNDIRLNIELGTMDDRTVDTYYGALHVLLGGLYKKYYIDQQQDTKIIVMTPIKLLQASASESGGTGTLVELDEWVEAVKKVAAFYSIPVLDMYNLSYINPHLNQTIQGTDEGYTGFYNPYITDGTHPTQKGHELMANVLTAFIENLM